MCGGSHASSARLLGQYQQMVICCLHYREGFRSKLSLLPQWSGHIILIIASDILVLGVQI